MTPKEKLRQHILDQHRRPHGPISEYTLAELRRFHTYQHAHQACDHTHGGPVTGPMRKPEGWYTGEHIIR